MAAIAFSSEMNTGSREKKRVKIKDQSLGSDSIAETTIEAA